MRAALAGMILCCCWPCLLSADETNLILTIDGETYSNVTWGTATPATVTAFHSSGIATLPLEKLPLEFKKQFGYERHQAAAYSNAQAKAEAASHLDRAATSAALNRVAPGHSYGRFEWDVDVSDLGGLRERYKALVDLQKTGHLDYQPAIRTLLEACKRGIERCYENGKGVPPARGNGGRGASDSMAPLVANMRRKEEVEHKEAVDAHNNRLARLGDEAKKSWAEGLKLKEQVDNKDRPPPPPPRPKKTVTDPYLKD